MFIFPDREITLNSPKKNFFTSSEINVILLRTKKTKKAENTGLFILIGVWQP